IIATSRNALRALAESGALGPALSLPIVTVGPATAEAAATLGFKNIIAGAGAAHDLPALIAATAAPNKGALVHLAGERLAFHLRGAFTAAGYEVRTVTAYRAVAAEALGERTLKGLAGGEIDAALLMSPRTAEIFAQLVAATGLNESAGRLVYI